MTGIRAAALGQRITAEIALEDCLMCQKQKDKGKLYALHEPEVDCISRGKALVRYEFATKVSVATTHNEWFVLDMRSMPGHPDDGQTLREALAQVEILTDMKPMRAFLDSDCRDYGVQTKEVYMAGQKRNITPALRRNVYRRSAIELMTGHMKTGGRLARRALMGTLGDALNEVLCSCGKNKRMMHAHCQAHWAKIMADLLGAFGTKGVRIPAQTGRKARVA